MDLSGFRDTRHGSKNWLQRAILHRHKKIWVCQGRLQAKSRWNYLWFCDGFSSISQDWSIRLSPRLVWYQILSVRFLGIQRGHQENPYEKDWATSRSVHLMEIWHNSWLEDVRHAKMDLSGPRETRQCPVKLASSSGSPRGNKGWRFTAGFKWGNRVVFHQFLRIDQFVWALVLCGIRYYQFASWESSGVIRKIHMRKIGRRQGRSTWWKFDTIHD